MLIQNKFALNKCTDLSVFIGMKSDTRNLIVNTASELFYEQGYNLTGINEIIAKAGIAKATLYSHFKSKEDLCIAYLDLRDSELLKNIKEFCMSKPKGNQRLIAVLEFLIPFFESDEFNGCWCIRTVAEIPRDNEKIKNKIKENKQQFLNFIKALVMDNKPQLTDKQQDKLANRIYILYESAVSESHLQDDAWPIHESIDLLKNILKSLNKS